MINPEKLQDTLRVSVIVPAFNVEEYLPKCLNSLYQQTLRPEEFEIIIIDDNSSDKTLQIAKNFTKKRSNIKIIHNSENLGPGVSRNKGLELAQGDYIYFIDGDDYIDPITLEQLLIEAYNNHADIVAASFARVNDQGEILFIKNEKKFFSSSRIQLLRNLLKFKIHHVVWNKLIKRELFDNSDIKFPEGLHEDVPMVRQLFLAAANVFYKPEIYYYWVKRKGSITSSITKSHIDDFLKGLVSMRKYIFEEYGGGVFRNVRDAIDYGMQAVVRVLSKRIVYSGSLKPHEKVSLYKYLYKRILEEPFLKESVLLETNEKDLSYKFFMLFSSKDLSSEEAAKDFENLVKVQPKKDKGIQSNIQEKSFRKFLISKIKKLPFFYKILKFLYKTTTHKGKLKDKYNYFIDRIVSFLYKKNIKRKNKNQHKNQLRKDCESKISHDVLFFADCDYHIRNAAIISELLLQRGFSTGIIDMTKRLNQGKRQLKEEERKKYQDLNFYEFDNNTYQNVDLEVLKVAIYFNDAGIHNRQIRNLRNKNIITIGIDEGVNDFLKLSEGFSAHLSPYRTTEYIFLPGEFETQFFKDRPGQYFVVGLPSIKKFYEEKPSFPKKPLIAINVNFTYGVLTNFREKFVKTAIKGCELADVDYVITQHPMDNGALEEYNMTDEDMYNTIRNCSVYISRFSGSIIEALAMGKPCIYHNPHNEKVLKFQEPMGAYSISDSAESLAKAIKYELKRSSKTPVREYSRKFMDYHANIHSNKEPEELIANKLIELIKDL